LILAACQATEEATPTPESEEATPTLSPTQASTATTEIETETAETAAPEPSPTSPVPSPTAPLTATPEPTATPSPTPPPDPTFYTIQSGDSLLGIADQFDVTLDELLYANGFASLDEALLIVGNQLQIPLCEAYQVASGNTLSGIGQLCDVTLDDLVTANIAALAPLGTVDAVPVGFVLVIPPPSSPDNLPACNPQPEREQVIEYTPAPGEGILCLTQMFGVSTATIIQANTALLSENVYGQVPLLFPPVSGAVLTINEVDINNSITLVDIADWYEVPVENIVDWNGNPVSDPLTEGQQLFIPGANLLFGVFQSNQIVTPTAVPGFEPTAEGTATPEP
jgi:LysM repeat protein